MEGQKMEELVITLAKQMKSVFGVDLISVSLHGSMASGDYHSNSDIDYFLVFRQISLQTLKKLKIWKRKTEEKYRVELSLNIQKESELPKYRGKKFYHKNRYALFLHESNELDKVLIGNNPFQTISLPTKKEVKLEAVRLINSFAYFLRKFIVNAKEDYSVNEAIRYVVIATQYANAFEGDFPLTTKKSVENFPKNFKNFKYKNLPKKFLKIKRGEKKIGDKNKILNEAILFLECLDEYISSRFN